VLNLTLLHFLNFVYFEVTGVPLKLCCALLHLLPNCTLLALGIVTAWRDLATLQIGPPHADSYVVSLTVHLISLFVAALKGVF
jgi:hypothetical protein